MPISLYLLLCKTALDDKVDKVSGKQLSTEDYTTAEKTKLANISGGSAGVVDNMDGTETDKAPSVRAVKSAMTTILAFISVKVGTTIIDTSAGLSNIKVGSDIVTA